MSDATTGIYCKLDRADEHVQTLHREIGSALNLADNGLSPDPNPKPNEFSLVARVRIIPDIAWSVRIGECVHDLRSALDHLAWQLASKHGNGTVPDGSEFPVFHDRAKYSALGKAGSPARGSGLYKIRGIAPNVQAEIATVQPFNPPGKDLNPLWLVHELSNFDKHRMLHLTTTIRGTTEITVTFTFLNSGNRRPLSVTPIFSQTGAVQDGAVVARFRTSGTWPNTEATAESNVVFDIGFDMSSVAVAGDPVAQTLSSLAFRVRELVNHLVGVGGL